MGRENKKDEVAVEIKDSKRSEDGYWNLRGEKGYNYNQKDSEREVSDEIKIRFKLSENRKLTEGQKQEVLKTILGEAEEPVKQKDERFSDRLVVLAALVLIPVIGLAFLITSTGF